MSTGNAPSSNNGAQPLQSQAQTPQSIRWEQFTDIGLCILVCDCKVKDLLEHMLAHAFFNNTGQRNKLGKKLCTKLSQHVANKGELKDHISNEMRLTLSVLRGAIQALGEDEGQLVSGEAKSLCETRNIIVHHKPQNHKFTNEEERQKFLNTYQTFITNFDFVKYCDFSGAEAEVKREEYCQLLVNYTDLVTMQSEYNNMRKEWEEERNELEEQVKTMAIELAEEIAERTLCLDTYEELFNKLYLPKCFESSFAKIQRRQDRQLSWCYKKMIEMCSEFSITCKEWEEERNELQNQVEEAEIVLEGEIADGFELKAERDKLKDKVSKQEQKLGKLKDEKKSMKELLRKTEEQLQSERDASKAKDQRIRQLEKKVEKFGKPNKTTKITKS